MRLHEPSTVRCRLLMGCDASSARVHAQPSPGWLLSCAALLTRPPPALTSPPSPSPPHCLQGLDPASRQNLWSVVKQAKRDRGIILTTHRCGGRGSSIGCLHKGAHSPRSPLGYPPPTHPPTPVQHGGGERAVRPAGHLCGRNAGALWLWLFVRLSAEGGQFKPEAQLAPTVLHRDWSSNLPDSGWLDAFLWPPAHRCVWGTPRP